MENTSSFTEQPLAYFQGSTRQSPAHERLALEGLQYADLNVLTELSGTEEDRESRLRKFVREGKKIALDPQNIEHPTIAKAAGIREIHDAGSLIGGKGQLFISGGSTSFNIDSDNGNRDETVRILQEIAPAITISK